MVLSPQLSPAFEEAGALGGDELVDGAEGAGEGGLGGALRLAEAAEQAEADKNRPRLDDSTDAVGGDARAGRERMREQRGDDEVAGQREEIPRHGEDALAGADQQIPMARCLAGLQGGSGLAKPVWYVKQSASFSVRRVGMARSLRRWAFLCSGYVYSEKIRKSRGVTLADSRPSSITDLGSVSLGCMGIAPLFLVWLEVVVRLEGQHENIVILVKCSGVCQQLYLRADDGNLEAIAAYGFVADRIDSASQNGIGANTCQLQVITVAVYCILSLTSLRGAS